MKVFGARDFTKEAIYQSCGLVVSRLSCVRNALWVASILQSGNKRHVQQYSLQPVEIEPGDKRVAVG